jgi:hypothetical protein
VFVVPRDFCQADSVTVRSGAGKFRWWSILLKAAERRYGLIGSLAVCLEDKRPAGKVDHSLRELPAQRVFSIACGIQTPTTRPARSTATTAAKFTMELLLGWLAQNSEETPAFSS